MARSGDDVHMLEARFERDAVRVAHLGKGSFKALAQRKEDGVTEGRTKLDIIAAPGGGELLVFLLLLGNSVGRRTVEAVANVPPGDEFALGERGPMLLDPLARCLNAWSTLCPALVGRFCERSRFDAAPYGAALNLNLLSVNN